MHLICCGFLGSGSIWVFCPPLVLIHVRQNLFFFVIIGWSLFLVKPATEDIKTRKSQQKKRAKWASPKLIEKSPWKIELVDVAFDQGLMANAWWHGGKVQHLGFRRCVYIFSSRLHLWVYYEYIRSIAPIASHYTTFPNPTNNYQKPNLFFWM